MSKKERVLPSAVRSINLVRSTSPNLGRLRPRLGSGKQDIWSGLQPHSVSVELTGLGVPAQCPGCSVPCRW